MNCMSIRPATTHALLGPEFYDPVEAASFPSHILRHRDQRWAARIGLDGLSDAEWIEHMGRFVPLAGSFPEPLALRYHGHQFRNYNPDLGDGRGFLFAQMHDLVDGRLLDLGTKGSGRTPWSRGGDGRLTLKGGVREILASSMLEALGVYTSKSLSLVETGEALERGDEPSPTRGAVLVRLSHSHIRIGSFQRLAALQKPDEVRRLLDHVIRFYMPELWDEDVAARAVRFLREVAGRVARLGAQWMAAGFVHGVLNTDNINVTGESFDYGPWRFLPRYEPEFTAAYFDHSGLYAYGRQPDTLVWNLVRLAECLLPLAPKEDLQSGIEVFSDTFQPALDAAVVRRLGLVSGGAEQDRALSTAWWTWLDATKVPFEQAFFDIRAGRAPKDTAFAPVQDVLDAYARAPGTHPYFQGDRACTMLIDEVEALWAPIAERDDWGPLAAKLAEIEVMRVAYEGTP